MEKDDIRYARRRELMVSNQLMNRGISDFQVLEAMSRVPRHLFVSKAFMDKAYEDHPLPIGEQQTISQPYIVAEMTQALQLGKKDRVLEIGTGSGYQAAIIAQIAYRVYTIERKHSLFLQARSLFDRLGYYNIVTRYSDGTLGWPEKSPFDAIIVTAGAPEIPAALVNQLAVGGRLVVPVGGEASQQLIKLVKEPNGRVRATELGGCRFVKLIGEQGWRVPS
ncbi:MAG: protein-L-isoaspartate(D-aspartate) O-methyltransferase [Thermodesulfobacteriota bacterium]